jgi:hypothetical protein
MIEAHHLPCAFVVTFVALGSERALVRIALSMARSTARRRRAERCPRPMTGLARERCMRTFQRIIGKAVVKSLAIQCDDGKAPAAVLGMAGLASDRQRATAVKPPVRGDILGHGLVAGGAQSRLGALVERRMAGRTPSLEALMRGAQRSGRNEMLEDRLPTSKTDGSAHRGEDEEHKA